LFGTGIHHLLLLFIVFLWSGSLISFTANESLRNLMLRDLRLAVLGAGKLGETLVKGLLEAGVIEVGNVTVTAGHQPRLDHMRERFGVAGTLSNAKAVEKADIILLAVKPQTVPVVVTEISSTLKPSQLLISVAASVSTAFIEKHLAAANAFSEKDPATGVTVLNREGHNELEAANETWHRYLKQTDSVNPTVASLMARGYFGLAETSAGLSEAGEYVEKAAEAQNLAAEGQPTVNSAQNPTAQASDPDRG